MAVVVQDNLTGFCYLVATGLFIDVLYWMNDWIKLTYKPSLLILTIGFNA